ncbi:Holliday junction resolvase RuvX [Marinicella rhabdoformis]|uniref:Holliday junction resolvase RuvX n=1 Tax=Marinicella rhabdoformis TaxID=2580566 RepID=UPI0012AEDAE7|nr:Holliday junction resolvase RuvX [Marinicella rhabdoformis]
MPEVYLGIDFGSKRIGLALGNSFTGAARALSVLPNNGDLYNALAKTIKEWQVTQIILGLPLDMDGEEQEITRQVKNFARKIKHHTQLPLNFVDERLTSFEAERQFKSLRQNSQAKAKNKDQIDAMAAQIILQSFLDQN